MKKTWIYNICVFIGLLVGSVALTVAQGSFFFWKQPRVPKHLKNT